MDDDDSNMSDDSYEFDDKAFDEELDNKNELDNEYGIGNEEMQTDYFINEDDEPKNDEVHKPENKEVGGNQEVDEEENVVHVSDADSGDDSEPADGSDVERNESSNDKPLTDHESEEPRSDATGSRMRYEVLSDLGEYWDLQNRTVSIEAADMVLSIIADYNKLKASSNTPQYGFRKGLEIFEEEGHKATVSELKENLFGRGCVKMLDKRDVNSDIRKKALAYLIFLKLEETKGLVHD